MHVSSALDMKSILHNECLAIKHKSKYYPFPARYRWSGFPIFAPAVDLRPEPQSSVSFLRVGEVFSICVPGANARDA
jgi:hypothetical protein